MPLQSPRLRMGPSAVAAACAAALLGPAHAPAIVSDVQPVDGPSADVVDVADAAMSEDGSGGLVYLKRVGGSGPRLRGPVQRRRLAGPAAGRRRPELRLELGADRRRRRRPAGRHLGAGVRGRKRPHVLGDPRPGRDRLPGAGPDRLQRRRGDLDLSRPGDEPRRPGLPRLPGGHRHQPLEPARATSAPTSSVARYNGRLWSVLGTPVDRSISDSGAARRRRQRTRRSGSTCRGRRGGRLAGARRRVRRPDLGAAPVRQPASASRSRPARNVWEGAPLRGPADAFDLDVAGFGQTSVAFRQQPGQASKFERAAADGQRDARCLLRIGAEDCARLSSPMVTCGSELGPPSAAVDSRGLYLRPASAPGRCPCSAAAMNFPRSPERAPRRRRGAALPATRSSTWPKRGRRRSPGPSSEAPPASSPFRSAVPTGSSRRPR